jgi:hypothetical protein
MRKAFLSTAVVLAATIGLTSAAGAASGPTSVTAARLATQAAAADYLRSIGIDPATVVVQRGAKNHAGPGCPGAGWNCTNAKQVLQISTTSGVNSFTCTPSGAGTASPHTCVIVQTSTTANNTAQCVIRRIGSGSAQQSCSITQTSVSGRNKAEVKQELALGGAATSATQTATVVQTNGSGANVVASAQLSGEAMLSGSASIGAWSQSVSQAVTIDQEAVTGTNTVEATQLVGQAQTALKGTSGSQSQTSDQAAEVDQFSHGVSKLTVKQTEGQLQVAKTTGVAQTQIGPQRCCSVQADNPANTSSLTQKATQIQKPGNDQAQQQTVVHTSTGNITGTQTTTQDGTTSTNVFSGSTVAEEQSCTDGTCEIGEPPPPPPPPPPAAWLPFNWTGPDGAVPAESPIVIAPGAPVVLSITDAFCRGDRFTISDGATTLGTTTAVPVDLPCASSISDPAVAFADPTYSHGTFALPAGAHSLGIVVSTSPFGSGTAFRSVDPMTAAHCTGGRWSTFTSPTFASEAACLTFVGT